MTDQPVVNPSDPGPAPDPGASSSGGERTWPPAEGADPPAEAPAEPGRQSDAGSGSGSRLDAIEARLDALELRHPVAAPALGPPEPDA